MSVSTYNRTKNVAAESGGPEAAVVKKGQGKVANRSENVVKADEDVPPQKSSPSTDTRPPAVAPPVRNLRGVAARDDDTNKLDRLPPRSGKSRLLGAHGSSPPSEAPSTSTVGAPDPLFGSTTTTGSEKLWIESNLLITWPTHPDEKRWQKRWCRLTATKFIVHTAGKGSQPEACVELFPDTTMFSFRSKEAPVELRASVKHGNGFVLGAEKLCGPGGMVYCDACDMAGQQGWVAALEDALRTLARTRGGQEEGA